VNLDGACDPAFDSVRRTLQENFDIHGERGAAVCVYQDGRKVVDVWGGHRDPAGTVLWTEDTLCIVYSISKSICALAVHMLADRGVLDLEAPVADVWPEFGTLGKEHILLRHTLSHHDGMCFADHASHGDVFRAEALLAALERQVPAWPPGTQGAYNSANIGYLLGEVVRRATGRRIDRFIAEEISAPLGVEFVIGLDEEQLGRLAELTPNPENVMFNEGNTPGTPLARAWRPMPEGYSVAHMNSRELRTGYVPSFGGHATARGMARIYAVLAEGGELDGVRLLSQSAIDRMTTEQWDQIDGTRGRPTRMGMGFFLNRPGSTPMGPNPRTFGHPGSGGALAFADPDARIAFCAQTNYQCEGSGVGRRTERLVEALYQSL
jgi:CubicO group peptidase (beta-lactamase class C family)